jgi:hypothetical protein
VFDREIVCLEDQIREKAASSGSLLVSTSENLTILLQRLVTTTTTTIIFREPSRERSCLPVGKFAILFFALYKNLEFTGAMPPHPNEVSVAVGLFLAQPSTLNFYVKRSRRIHWENRESQGSVLREDVLAHLLTSSNGRTHLFLFTR